MLGLPIPAPTQTPTKKVGGGGMDPFISGALINTGGQLLGGLASWLGNRGAYNRALQNYKADRRGLEGMIGKDVLDPTKMLSQVDAASIPKLQQQGRAIQRASGNISAADAQGALWERTQGDRNSLLAQLMEKNAMEKSNRDLQIRSQLYNSSAGMLGQF